VHLAYGALPCITFREGGQIATENNPSIRGLGCLEVGILQNHIRDNLWMRSKYEIEGPYWERK
jgi:hypothetical protein